MSLEAAIIANTAVVTELIETWKALVNQGKQIDPKSEITAGGKPLTAGPKSVKGASTPAAGSAAQTASVSQPAASAGVSRDDMSKLIVSAAAKLGRERVLAILQPFGATGGKTVKDDDIQAVHDAVTEALNAPESMK